MKFGVHLPHIGPQATRENVMRFAQEAESLGFDSCWVSDHIAYPDTATLSSRYPYNASGDFTAPAQTPWLDAVGTLLFIAGCTERLQLGTTVMILGYRPPIQTAKLWATLDAVSGGRAILGVGVGWMREEFEALGMPFDRRGARADESLEIFDALFTEDMVTFEGPFTKFGPIGFAPKPVSGSIPIWVGGHSAPAFRRAARYGDAFHAVFIPPDQVAEQWAEVGRFCDEAGREGGDVALTLRLRLAVDSDRDDHGALRGSTTQIVDAIGRYAEVDVSHMTLDVQPIEPGGVDGQIAAMQRFADEVRPQVG
ncbi:MAG: LLM class F420-dependent oxidoreductase [Dehalococcoidia bacterium]